MIDTAYPSLTETNFPVAELEGLEFTTSHFTLIKINLLS